MVNNAAPYRWVKIKNGIGVVAIVTIEVVPNSEARNEIIEHYSGKGFIDPSITSNVITEGFDSWKIAARNGLEYGFSLVDSFWTVHIISLEGRAFIDTNAAVVGYTMLRAFLDRIGFQLDANKIQELDAFVMSSWVKPYRELVPDFFNLTFTEY